MAKMKKSVSEEDLLKALGELEGAAEEEQDDEEVAKGDDDSDDDSDGDDGDAEESEDESSDEPTAKGLVPPEWKNTKAANGGQGMAQVGDEDAEHFETGADEDADPTKGGKTMKSLVAENPDLQKGFEVSAFLETLTDAVTESVDGLRKSVVGGMRDQQEFNAKTQKALIAMGNMLMKLSKSQRDADEQPALVQPRSVISKSQISERFESEQAEFTREDVLKALTDMAMENQIPTLVVSAYEAGGHMAPEYIGAVNLRLKAMAGRR